MIRTFAPAFAALFLIGTLAAQAQSDSQRAAAPSGIERVADGIVVACDGGFVKLEVRSPAIVRVRFARERSFFSQPSLMIVPPASDAPVMWHVLGDESRPTIDTGVIRAAIDPATGRVTFSDEAGTELLAESARALEPADVQGQHTFHLRQQWAAHDDESLYGLGQHQLDAINLKGLSIDLWQRNTSIVVPLLVSSRGYGIFWNNLSLTRFGDLAPWQPLGGSEVLSADGTPGGLTGTYFAGADFKDNKARRIDAQVAVDVSFNRDELSADGPLPTTLPTNPHDERSNAGIHPALPPGDASIRWEGSILPTQSGDYQFHNYANGGIKLTVGETVLFDHWRQGWLPADDIAKIHLEAGRKYPIVAEWKRSEGANVFKLDWKPPTSSADTSLWSEVGGGVDYYFIYGPGVDQIVAGMRDLTGRATMLPRWAFGLWQSRQRYETQQASLDVVDGFRKRSIPFDNIVQDWQYWHKDAWGSHIFDAERFPDPVGWINSIHQKNAHLMISVWGKFYPGTANYDELLRLGFLYPLNIKLGTRDWLDYLFTGYDAFNPAARKVFWRQMKTALFDKGVDAWWMDATEPDIEGKPTLEGLRQRMTPNAEGTGAAVLNGYAVQNARGVYEGQRAAAPDQRVFNLTRSGGAGQQRFAAASWSGDITSSWTAMRKQIPAGLGFCISGVPYWTMDSGGFSVPQRFARKDASADAVDEWRELNTRWFQFATFVPLLRVHGEFPLREMWEFGGEDSPAYKAQLKFDRLRYRMLPYVYSLAGAVNRNGGTIMRALVFDFAEDAQARDRTDEFLFGQSMLISPVLHYKERAREVYLPAGAMWYDFWTGKPLKGGQKLQADAPFDAIPIHVRAGAIIPFGPDLQYTSEKPADPVTLYVYSGANGDFTLYEDDGLSYGYERNEFSTIPLHWDEARKALTIGVRHGAFPGMLEKRTFQITIVTPDKPVGFSFEPKADRTVSYDGSAVMVRAQ